MLKRDFIIKTVFSPNITEQQRLLSYFFEVKKNNINFVGKKPCEI